MANDPMRSKAAAVFGKEFMNVVKGNDPKGNQVNAAQALQKRANARPIPVYKEGGAISKAAVDQARVATRAKAAGYKEGGVKKKADGGSVDRNKARLDRKIADIEKDYQKAQSSGKGSAVAKAKYEQRMADARDDYAKWTKADRTETRAGEAAAEKALSEARRTKGASIVKRDAPSVMAEMVKNEAPIKAAAPADDLAKTIKVQTEVARKTGSKPVQRGAASRSNGRTTSTAAPTPAPAAAQRQPTPQKVTQKQVTAPAPAAPRRANTAAGDVATALERSATQKRAAMAQPNTNEGRLARLADWFGMGATADENRAKATRLSAMQQATAQAERDKAAFGRSAQVAQRLAQLKAAASAPGASQLAKDRYRLAAQSGMVGNFAAGGAAKVRKGQAPIKKGK